MNRTPQHIGKTMKLMFKDMGIDKKIRQHQVLEKWPELVGEQIANMTSAERVHDKILYIKVKSMTWRTELLFQKQSILKRIADNFGSDVIMDICFH